MKHFNVLNFLGKIIHHPNFYEVLRLQTTINDGYEKLNSVTGEIRGEEKIHFNILNFQKNRENDFKGNMK